MPCSASSRRSPPRYAPERVLGRRVEQRVAVHPVAEHRAQIDDLAGLALRHVAGHQPGQHQDRMDVEPPGFLPVGGVAFEEGHVAHPSDAIDQDVDRRRRPREIGRERLVGQVAGDRLDGSRGVPAALREPGKPVAVAARRDDGFAPGGEGLGDRAADTAGRPGDQNAFRRRHAIVSSTALPERAISHRSSSPDSFRAAHPPPAPPASGRGEDREGPASESPLPRGERVRVRGKIGPRYCILSRTNTHISLTCGLAAAIQAAAKCKDAGSRCPDGKARRGDAAGLFPARMPGRDRRAVSNVGDCGGPKRVETPGAWTRGPATRSEERS